MSDNPEILACSDGRNIAYCQTHGSSPGVIFLSGFKSDMNGTKAVALEKFCKSQERSFLRFDYTGHGKSSGCFEDGTIGQWSRDAILVLDELCKGPQILVGSSMGGWIMLLVAIARPEKIAGLIGIAAAPDFTEDLIENKFLPDQLDLIAKQGFLEIPNCYDEEPYKITKALLDDGQNHLLLNSEIPIECPVRLIHGVEDQDVQWKISLRLAKKLKSQNVETLFVKGGDHRLSEQHDLNRMCQTLDSLLAQL